MVIFDPNIKYLKNYLKNNTNEPGIRLDLSKAKKNDLQSYYDQFKPYENLFGCDIFKDDFNYNGTLIRLPFRNEISNISNKIYDEIEINKLLEILFENIDLLMLFTQSLKQIEVYVLEDSQTPNEMKLLFKHENSLIKLIQKHDINIGSIDEFKQQTSILKASKIDSNNIETAMIVKGSTSLNQVNIIEQFKNENIFSNQNSNTFWMIISSIEHNHLLQKKYSELINFTPCVGIATQLDFNEENRSFILKKNDSNDGLAFCFLPLPIKTNLNYHINGNFILSEDRLHIYENSTVDKETFKHIWNLNLINPLINNLFRMISLVTKHCSFESNNLVKHFWPLKNKTNYFIELFEEKFFQEILSSEKCIFPANNDLVSFKNSLFIDFQCNDFQSLAIESICELLKNQNMKLISLEPEYLAILKEKLKILLKNENCLINNYSLLKYFIDNKYSIDHSNYEKIISFYLKENIPLTNQLLKSSDCIPTAVQNTFKPINYLINPNASEFYIELFGKKCNRFPSDYICNDKHAMISLQSFEMINEVLTADLILDLAQNVESLFRNGDIINSKKLSLNLITYLLKLKDNNLKLDKLNNINWIYSKQKPDNWYLPWYSETNKLYKPIELVNDSHQLLAGCVRPIFDSKVCYKSLLLLDLNEKFLIDCSIEQLKLLIKFNSNLDSDIICQIEEFLRKFYTLLQKYTTNNEDITCIECQQRLNYLKLSLPSNWIYCRENKKDKFLSADSFAFKVSNPIEPEMLQMSFIYTSSFNNREKDFFKQFGIADCFNLENLILKLKKLQILNGENPLNESQFEVCTKIANEIISIEKKFSKENEIYLPDSDRILREKNKLCKVGKFSSIESHNMFKVVLLP